MLLDNFSNFQELVAAKGKYYCSIAKLQGKVVLNNFM